MAMAAFVLSRETVCLGAGDVSVVASRFSGARTRNALRCGSKTKGLGGLELANPSRAKLVVVRNVAVPLTLVPEPETAEASESKKKRAKSLEDETALEGELEAHLEENRASLQAVKGALAADVENSELIMIREALLEAVKGAEESLLHLKRTRLLRGVDAMAQP